MKLSIHLNFSGNAADAFTFYKEVFKADPLFLMPWKDAPAEGSPKLPADWQGKIMHASLPLGSGLLMGCDAPPTGPAHNNVTMGGFQVSVETKDAAEVERIYNALKEGGSVQMPLMPTFWSPLFGMCTDKFGVAWMVGMPGAGQ